MSKRTSKILIVAIVAILAISMISLVACSPLDSKKAMTQLQEGFDAATNKTVTEDIKLGGLSVNLAKVNVTVAINNVDVHLVRKYTGKKLNIDATISNLQASIPGFDSKLKGLLGSVLGGLNLDEAVISNLSKVKIHANLDIDQNMVLNVYEFAIIGLPDVKDAAGNTLSALKDGDKKWLPAVYKPGELNPGENETSVTIDPRHEKDPNNAKDQPGLFTAMDEYGNGAGKILEDYLKANYTMVTPYEFDEVKVSGTKFTAKSAAKFDKLFEVGQQVIGKYENQKIDKLNKTLGSILTEVVGTTNLKDAIGKVADLGTAELAGECEKVDGAVRPTKLNVKETVSITISNELIGKVVGLIPGAGSYSGLIGNIIGDAGLTGSVNSEINAEFKYE